MITTHKGSALPVLVNDRALPVDMITGGISHTTVGALTSAHPHLCLVLSIPVATSGYMHQHVCLCFAQFGQDLVNDNMINLS